MEPQMSSKGLFSSGASPDSSVFSIPGVKERYHNFVKPAADKRDYRGLLLTNRLKVVLVSDPDTDKSAAGLSVQVGTYSDPDEILGLAHLCKCMLVIGTKTYPKENEFNKFISEHGGSTIERIWCDRTEFCFDVTYPYLKKALDMFAEILTTPLFPESAIDREIYLINSEFESYKSSDYCPMIQLKKSISDPEHPFYKFNMGNKETLKAIPESKGINIREELLKFHQKWYSTNIMSLIVVGKESLDELEAMIVPLFSNIEDKSITVPSWPLHPFPPELRRRRMYSLPTKNLRYLNIDFPIPCTRKHYKTKPIWYLSHLIDYKGPGSILSALKRREWCYRLRSGSTMSTRGFDFFSIQVNLTEKGINHIDEIIGLIFQYLTMLKIHGPQYLIWEEQKKIMDIEFRSKEVQDPLITVRHHVDLIQEYPIGEIFSVDDVMTEWKPELVTELISLLTPENIIVHIAAKVFKDKCTTTEFWYGTKYHVEYIDEIQLKEWSEATVSDELYLPTSSDYQQRKQD
ncbi:unnamed protein product [Arctia plantaginis]|uniref:Insulin-degrading enzyme n=1 Tax=Arctia plantaginis TaxID=874455 RepID=A0A8S0YZ17_ARCPL|nr:unnamed protein product [Arctia plantaginis]